MKEKPLILFLEDVQEDFVLVKRELNRSGLVFQAKRVESKAEFVRELQEHPPDLILSDHGLHEFDSFSALALARQKVPAVPVIILTGSLGEEMAVRALKSGATDYVLKHRLAELAPAVRHALLQVEAGTVGLGTGDDRYRRLVQSVQDYAIYLLDNEGRVNSWNEGAELIQGYSAEEAIGLHYSSFFTPADVRKGKPAQILSTAAATGLCRDKGWRLRQDGSRFWADAVVTALRDDAGQLIGFSKVVRDLSERRRIEDAAQESKDHLSLAVEAAGLGTWDYNPVTGQAIWSARCKEAFGLPPDAQASSEQFLQRVHPEDRSRVEEVIHKAMDPNGTGRYENDYRVLWQDGTVRWIISKGKVFFREIDSTRQPVRFIGILLDVTERRKSEQALADQIRRFNAELEQRVAQRTALLEIANKELEAFSYSVSHDLRAPLRHIDGFADLLRHSLGERLDPTNREYLHIITESTHQMGKLIDALLAFSRMGRTAMHRSKVNMKHLIDAARHDLRYDMEGRKIEWMIGVLPEVTGDPSLLRQVFLNLLSNALKYTRTRDLARIEIGATETEHEKIFFVRDNGIGFDMQYADKLFGVFQRLHGAAEFEGTGIGLANVRRIIQRHGGRTWAEAKPDRGATFYFSLPTKDLP